MRNVPHFQPISVADYLAGEETYVGYAAMIELPEIDCRLALSDLYEHVEFPAPLSDDEEHDDRD